MLGLRLQLSLIHILIEDIRQGEYHIYNRCLLSVKMGDVSYMALNEVRLENNRRSQVLGVYINGDFLETFRGNGLCVSCLLYTSRCV